MNVIVDINTYYNLLYYNGESWNSLITYSVYVHTYIYIQSVSFHKKMRLFFLCLIECIDVSIILLCCMLLKLDRIILREWGHNLS